MRLGWGLGINGFFSSNPTAPTGRDEASARTARQPEGAQGPGGHQGRLSKSSCFLPSWPCDLPGAPSGSQRQAAGREAAGSSLVSGLLAGQEGNGQVTDTSHPRLPLWVLCKSGAEVIPSVPHQHQNPRSPFVCRIHQQGCVPVHSFYCCVIFHCKAISHITYPFSSQLTLAGFQMFVIINNAVTEKTSYESVCSRELPCGLRIQGEFSFWQTAGPPLPFPALFISPPLRRAMGQPRNPDRQTHDSPQMEHRAGSLPAVGWLALGRRNSCCPAARCSLLSTAGEKGVVSDGRIRRVSLTLPRPPWHSPVLLQQIQCKIILGHFHWQTLPSQQVQVGISKFHMEVTLWCMLGEGKLISPHLSPAKR